MIQQNRKMPVHQVGPINQIRVHPFRQAQQDEAERSEMAISVKRSEQVSLSSNTMKYKLPEIILKYIVDKAKQSKQNKQLTKQKNLKPNMFMKAASVISQNKKVISTYKFFKCNICQLELPELEKERMSLCQHFFCLNCLHQYIIYKISRFEMVQCPEEGCKSRINEDSKCFSQLPIDAKKKYLKIKQYSDLLETPNKKLCPNEQCDGFLQNKHRQQQNQGVIVISNLKCNKCNEVYCSSCNFKEHEGECDPHQLTFFQQTLHYRQCSRCKNVIDKSSGCNHMTCRCGYQFCYLCGARWKQSHICKNLSTMNIEQQNTCTCWNQCCEAFEQCLDECCSQICQCCSRICQNCCEPICSSLNNCCQCDCCDRSQSCGRCGDCFEFTLKLIFTILLFIILTPAVYFQATIMILFRIVVGMFIGIFGFTCLLPDMDFQIQWYHYVIGILLLPFTLIILMFLGIKYIFTEDDFLDQMKSLLLLPCTLANQLLC